MCGISSEVSMGKYDLARLTAIIEGIGKYLDDLDKLSVHNLSDLKNEQKYYAASMVLFQLINRAINLADGVVSAENLGMPESYRNIFQRLVKAKIINDRMYQDFSALVRVRNLIAHEYETLFERDIYEAMQKIKVINELIAIVKSKANGKRNLAVNNTRKG